MVLDNGRFLTQELANITHMIDEHFRIALSANKIVVNGLFGWLDEEKKVTDEELRAITELEEKGDNLKRRILNELAKANSLLQREDLLRLVHYNDKLIDGAEIACYHLAAVIDSWVPSGQLRYKLHEFGEALLSIVSEQREAVRFLALDIEKSMERADAICKIEKKIDIILREIITVLYASDLALETLLRFRDFLMMMEEVANFSEDAAIAIRGLSLTLNI